jgi:Cys-Gly metallodipeptidase DUG1
VKTYLEAEFAKLNSKNKMTIEHLHGGKPWVTDHKHWNYEAAKRATEVSVIYSLCFDVGYDDGIIQTVYKQTPDLTREGGSIPVTLTFAETLGVNVLLLPMGRGDDGAQ